MKATPEAYIPTSPTRPRSLAILAEAARVLSAEPDHIAVCSTCGLVTAVADPATRVEHAEDGGHVMIMTYGDGA
jgi:hypothetical protein